MGEKTGIEWTESTWSPVTGCTKVSLGCDNCYAERIAERFRGTKGHAYENGFDLTLRPERLDQPLKWKKPRMIFVCSMADLFHKDVPDKFIRQVYEAMRAAPQHTYQVLTKRPQRMAKITQMLFNPSQPPLNIWHGTSVENQDYTWRLDHLENVVSDIRWVSAEPLLGPLDLTPWLGANYYPSDGGEQAQGGGGLPSNREESSSYRRPRAEPSNLEDHSRRSLAWIVVGGESGPGARYMDPDWARSLRDQCANSQTAFYMKQMSKKAPIPQDLVIRQFPNEHPIHKVEKQVLEGQQVLL